MFFGPSGPFGPQFGLKIRGAGPPSLGSATGHLPCFPAFPYLPILVLFLVFHVFIFCSVARICGVALSSLALSIKDILEACRRKSYQHQLTPGTVSHKE